MIRRAAALVAAAGAVAAPVGCGEDDARLPSACTVGVRPVLNALRAAPATVRVQGTTRLSTCVERARSDADIQTVGGEFTRAADELAARMAASDAAALQLGYLIGAARRGGSGTTGIHEELLRRLEQTAGLDGAPGRRRAAFRRGEAAGERDG